MLFCGMMSPDRRKFRIYDARKFRPGGNGRGTPSSGEILMKKETMAREKQKRFFANRADRLGGSAKSSNSISTTICFPSGSSISACWHSGCLNKQLTLAERADQNSHSLQLCGSRAIRSGHFSVREFQKSRTSDIPGASRCQSSGISCATSSQLTTSIRPPFFSFWVQ